MSTILDELAARQRLHTIIPKLTDDETSLALRVANAALPVSAREAAIQQLFDSSDVACEWLRAWHDMCCLYVLSATPATSGTEIN